MNKILIIIALSLSLFSAENKKPKIEVKPEFKCEGKKYCKEMSSCKEAMFYLKQCGDLGLIEIKMVFLVRQFVNRIKSYLL